MIIITSHGGENFIKVRGRSVILSDELNRALNEMHIKERYKEILFIVDTCEGFSLFEFVDVPNVYFVASSVKHQKAHSYSFDPKQMTPTADRFHYKLHQILERIHQEKNFKTSIDSIFLEMQAQREFINSDVTFSNRIPRNIIFEEFFGNALKRGHSNRKYNFDLTTKDYTSINLSLNNELGLIKAQIDDYTLDIKKYEEKRFVSKKPDLNLNKYVQEIFDVKNLLANFTVFLFIIYTLFHMIK
jgi:glycosylphosphatidylinositol transamidase (GPIT) subunit GPI8